MARIMYGVSGEGSGHAIRSREVIRFLQTLGHDVEVFTDGRGLELLQKDFSVTPIAGIHFAYEENAVRVLRSIWKNVVETPALVENAIERLPPKLRTTGESLRLGTENVQRMVAKARDFQPHFFITDFEPFTAVAAAHLELPLLCIDNIHRLLLRPTHPPLRYRHHWLTAKTLVRLFAPRVSHYIVPDFRPTVELQQNVTFVPPIIQPKIFAAAPKGGEHILVYSSYADSTLPEILMRIPAPFVVYGYRRNEQRANITFRTFSEDVFLDDATRAKAVIGTGGFTLMSECLVLKKPYLALPVRGQFEQIANALQFVEHGWGHMANRPSVRVITKFLGDIPVIEKNLQRYEHPGNGPAFNAITDAVKHLS